MKIDQIIWQGKMAIGGVLAAIVFTACSPDTATNIPDVSDIEVQVDLTRFEDLLLADTLFDAAEMQQLKDQYPAFAGVYFNHVIPGAEDVLASDDPEIRVQQIRQWIRHPRTRWLYDTVRTILPDIQPVLTQLEGAFRYAKYYFPEKETPRVFTTLSDFGYFPFIYAEDSLRDGIGISLEMFLGERFPYRDYVGLNNAFSEYLVRSYNQDHMVKRAMEIWIDDMAGPPPGNRLIDYMIHNGKKLFVLQSLMPQAHDSVIIDYPSAKLDYVNKNERNIWYHFTAQDMLYETSLNKIQKYIGPSPTSPGMPPEAPGNTASWLGWRIVQAYMKKHPETSLQQILALADTQKLLDDSGYRPPR